MKKFFTVTGLFLLSIVLLGFFKKENEMQHSTTGEQDDTDWTGEGVGDWYV